MVLTSVLMLLTWPPMVVTWLPMLLTWPAIVVTWPVTLLTSASTALNWLTLTASVGAEPAATLVTRRSLPEEPTETSPAAVAAAIAVAPGPFGV
jgi:hypothetical protein